jgi:hypothetical protein
MTPLTPTDTGTGRSPFRQKSAQGQPKPNTSIERRCKTCGASFTGLAPGKTGETGIWHAWHWYCSIECAPAKARPAPDPTATEECE